MTTPKAIFSYTSKNPLMMMFISKTLNEFDTYKILAHITLGMMQLHEAGFMVWAVIQQRILEQSLNVFIKTI